MLPKEVHSNCIFCKIGSDDGKGQEVLYKDDETFIIKDISPHAPHHYLVIPRKHLPSANALTKCHTSLVERLSETGVTFLKEKLGENQFDESQLRVGFHCPPLITVKHLHLHVLYPVNQMWMFWRTLIFSPGYFFRPVRQVIDYIKTKPDVTEENPS